MKRIIPLLVVVLIVVGLTWRNVQHNTINLTEQLRNFDLSDQSPVTTPQGGWFYLVRRGDTLESIARQNGVSTREIIRLNHLQSRGLLIDQRLIIPSEGIPAQGGVGQVSQATINIEMLAKLIRAEAEAEPYTGQVAVGAVLLNRIESPKFPNTLASVIYQPHAFESVSNGTFNQPATDSCRRAAQSAVQGWDPSGGALFFFNPSKTSSAFMWSRKIIQRIGHHVFTL